MTSTASSTSPTSTTPKTTTTAADGPPRSGPRVVPPRAPGDAGVRVPYRDLLAFVADVLVARGLPEDRAGTAAEALCHGDLTGFTSHGVTNLTRLYLPLLDSGRCDPRAEPRIVADHGASVLLDARRALGLWAAAEAMELAVERAREYGVGMVSVRGATHFGCAGHHALRAVRHHMVGLVTANCGRQRIVRPVGGRSPMLGTNPLALAAPAGDRPPFVLDMATTVAPTGRIRAAARAGRSVPEGWLHDEDGAPVTDPAAFDRGEAHLSWLGGAPDTGAYKGFGLGLLVEVLSALVPGAGLGPSDAVPQGAEAGGPDDDIGCFLLAVAPGRLRSEEEFLTDAAGLFGALLGCPPVRADEPVRYPGWPEDARCRDRRAHGVPLGAALHEEMLGLARSSGLRFPAPCAPAPEAGSPA
ncbi:Ldh family oxidoreductase [Streptomyces lomondensis]|uniref:Malate dehydrogenase n=1 Tax=Streptomyces lomondensis TaxID=68229 RepID=A0ABQ2X616_9ACTN|nr:Ldh family oxidoreductase [Streptomyces lomondensis]MCF0078200.1 Ldh family oxidoreductase [Streptomyces lomondensis]GGX01152.1 malate dehydrogenase [Streptomyces lomondensis]